MAVSIFGATKVSAPSHNVFDLSHNVKFTTNAGYLRPIACIPVVPGDTFDLSADLYCRLAPLATPVLHNIDVRLEAFYVPNRLLWDNWEKFIVFEHKPDNDPKPVLPYLDLRYFKTAQDTDGYNRVGIGSLADHLGIPVTQLNFETGDADMKVSALPFAAYQKIWLDYYCDKNIQQAHIDEFYHGDGKLKDGDNSDWYNIIMQTHHRMWRKDYFTSALPDAQRGADVLIPTQGSNVDISFKNVDPSSGYSAQPSKVIYSGTGEQYVGASTSLRTSSNGETAILSTETPISIDNSGSLKGTLTGLNATITDLRTAMATQRLLELSMRVGSRLKEQLKGIFGVNSSDSRLDRVEYLGGSTVPIMISEVAQTSETTSNSPQANLAGRGAAAGSSVFGRKYFEEHGYLMVIASVVPKSAYFQGMPRHFKLFDTEDFYWPMFQHIGEQAIRKEEIYFGTSDENNNDTFGYTPRYAEYKWLPSTVHGEFRDVAGNNGLGNMHLARYFASRPALNTDFLEIKGQSANRAFAYTENDFDHFWFDVYLKIKAKRPMDYFGSPR